MEEGGKHERWVNREKARYYETHLWGGCGSNRGRLASTGVASYGEGLDALREIGERRSARGYQRAG
jgi:hypothetical protein